jgi:hypothetical protein
MRRINPGKREREARKRHRRGRIWNSGMAAESAPLKLGSKKIHAYVGRTLSRPSVADAESSEPAGILER